MPREIQAWTIRYARMRRLVATDSKREAARLMGVSDHDFRQFGMNAGHADSALALKQPGVVFERPQTSRDVADWKVADAKPYEPRRVGRQEPPAVLEVPDPQSPRVGTLAGEMAALARLPSGPMTLIPEDRHEIAGCGGIEHQNGTTTVTLHFVDEEAADQFMRVGKPAVKSADMPLRARSFVVKGRPMVDLADTVMEHAAGLNYADVRAVLAVLDDIGAGVVVPARPNPAVEAIKYSMDAEESYEFLRCWLHGDFDVCRREWPDSPAACYPDTPVQRVSKKD